LTDQQDTRRTRSREEVAYVCARLDQIRTSLERYGREGAAPLERVVAALRAEEDPVPALDALHEALLVAGDAVGLHGRVRGLSPLGVDADLPDEWVLLCPTGQCARHAWPDGGDAEPPCRVSGRPLRRARL
jgi:hypothetical protein